MPSTTGSNAEGDRPPKLTRWERLRYTMVKADDAPGEERDEPQLSVPELEASIARADDKERNVGLVASPLAAIIGLVVTADLINHAKSLHQSTSTYQTLTFVLLGMSILMLALSWFRKRLMLGIVMALYGISIFNLKYWGFGVPFVMAGAWYLVRAYRLQQRLKATLGAPDRPRSSSNRLPSAGGTYARPNRRYTPPTEKLRRTPKTEK